MDERVVEELRTQFKESKATINQYTFSWDTRLLWLKRKLAVTGSGPFVLKDDLEELLDWDDRASSGEQAETGSTDGVLMRFLETYDLGADNPVTQKLDAENQHVLKCGLLLCNVMA